jgi:hypothetical protein
MFRGKRLEVLSPEGKISNGLFKTVVALLVEALCYKPGGRGFESRVGRWIFFNLPNPSSRIPEDISWGKARTARTADNLTVIYEPIV